MLRPFELTNLSDVNSEMSFYIYTKDLPYPKIYSFPTDLFLDWVNDNITGGGGGGGIQTASNGLTLDGDNVELGGSLDQSTTITVGASQALTISASAAGASFTALSDTLLISNISGGGFATFGGAGSTNIAGNTLIEIGDGSSAAGVRIGSAATGALRLPSGADPDTDVTSPANGDVKYDSTDNDIRAYVNSAWRSLLPLEAIILPASAKDTDIAVETDVAYLDIPFNMEVTSIHATLLTAGTGSTVNVDVNIAGSTVFSTPLTIDDGETTSRTAATAAVISNSTWTEGQRLTIDIDQIGSTVAGQELNVEIQGYRI